MEEKMNDPGYWRQFNNYLNKHTGLMVFMYLAVKVLTFILRECLK